jgi:hypothetical protein
VSPGAYVFCTGAEDPEGAYARDMALVPTEPLRELPAGSRIHYRALQFVYGDNATDQAPVEQECERWQRRPLTVEANVGTVLATDPPEIAAAGGRIVAEVSGGTDWLPVRLAGFDPGRPLSVRQTDSTGARMLGPGTPEEPWYSAWPAGAGRCGFTVLVRTDPGGGVVGLEAWQ